MENFDNEDLAIDLPAIARRQLVGSLVAAVAILVAAGLTTLKPASHERFDDHRFAVVQQPSFAALPEHRLAALERRVVELP